MNETKALVRLEPLKPLNADALPRYFSGTLALRVRERSDARTEAVGKGFGAAFFAFCASLASYLSGLLMTGDYPLPALLLLTLPCAAVAYYLAGKDGWASFERFGYLRGTRDETKYLPEGCREYAAAEVSLSVAFYETDEAAVRWNAALPLLEEHGTPKLRRIAAAGREIIEARRRAIAVETGRLWSLAARSTNPPALPAKPAVRELAPPSDWGVTETIDLANTADS